MPNSENTQTDAYSISNPASKRIIRDYHLPWISPHHRRSDVQYLAREETPIPQNNQVMGYALTEENKTLKRMTVRLGVTHRSVLESVLYVLRRADLTLVWQEVSHLFRWGMNCFALVLKILP